MARVGCTASCGFTGLCPSVWAHLLACSPGCRGVMAALSSAESIGDPEVQAGNVTKVINPIKGR